MHSKQKKSRQRRVLRRRFLALAGLSVSAAFLFFPRMAHATTWEDHTALQATAGGGTSTPVQVKASHIIQMRSVIDALRGTAACGSLAPLNWRTVGTGVTIIADDINSIKTEISDPRYNVPAGLLSAIPTITPTASNATSVRASHIIALRAAIDAANCSGGATCSDGIQNQDETGVDCGGSVCPPCNAPACWGCFDAGGSPSGAYCYSDGSIGQTSACTAACAPPFPLPAQVPMFYCGATSITARIGDAAGICSAVWDVYYVAPPATGFQQGALVYYDSSLNNPVLTDLIGDAGGAIYDLTGPGGNQIGPPTGNSC